MQWLDGGTPSHAKVANPMRSLAFWLCVALALGAPGCRCGGGLEQVTPSFQASPALLDFGRVLEGSQVTLPVTVTADTRVEVTVSATTSAPFSSAASLVVPGSSQLNLPVGFTAGHDDVSGTLVLSTPEKSVSITLHGVGVKPLVCTPSGPCKVSTFSLEQGQCLETDASDETACDPGSLCLEQGRCKAGQCLGIARKCDDNDACTRDGCSNTVGCVHSPITCPRPTTACRTATCSASTGCGEAMAPDGDLCGAASCSTVALCNQGRCETVVTPEGTPCGAELACIPAGACRHQKCERPDAGDWQPTWSATLPAPAAGPLPTLLGNGAAVFLELCGVWLPDAGVDAGCGLFSWTSTGFDRFAAPLDEASRLVHVSTRGVLVQRDGGLELRSAGNGSLIERVEATPRADAIVGAPDGAVWFVTDDGALKRWTAGALETVTTVDQAGALTMDDQGGLFLFNGDGRLDHLDLFSDGGMRLRTIAVDAGPRSLTVAGQLTVAGLGTAVTLDPTLGVTVTPLDREGLTEWLDPRGVLHTLRDVAFFTHRCPSPLVQCLDAERMPWVSLNALESGTKQWEAQVIDPGYGVTVVEPALFDFNSEDGGPTLAVGMLAEVSNVAASRVALQLFADGERRLVCALDERTRHAFGAVFQGHQLFVLAGRSDGGSALEAYDLKSLPLHQRDWSAPAGAQGQRR